MGVSGGKIFSQASARMAEEEGEGCFGPIRLKKRMGPSFEAG
jgi:hypothetical protein